MMRVYEEISNTEVTLTDGEWIISVNRDDLERAMKCKNFAEFFDVRKEDVEKLIGSEFGNPEDFRYR